LFNIENKDTFVFYFVVVLNCECYYVNNSPKGEENKKKKIEIILFLSKEKDLNCSYLLGIFY